MIRAFILGCHPPRRRCLAFAGLAALGTLLSAGSARAQQYRVTLDTTGLAPTSIFTSSFGLTNGGGAGSSVTLSSFVFGGGSPLGSPTTSGGASGNMSGSVRLATTAASFSSDFTQTFQRGSQIGFIVNASALTAKPDPSDRLTFSLLNAAASGTPVATSAPDGFTLFALERGADGFRTEAYGYTSAASQTYLVQISAVPEPGLITAFGLAGAGGMGLLARRRYRKI